ncbi:MAG: FMN-binding protein [Defluviitaleaceae bacterium]|nr:FMN-binding protein [Defluviitaleaceae bacterium]
MNKKIITSLLVAGITFLSSTNIFANTPERFTTNHLRVAINNYTGTRFTPIHSENPRETRFDAGRHVGFMRPYKGGVGLGTGQTAVAIYFGENEILDMAINSHMDTTENPTDEVNTELVRRAVAAQGPNFEHISEFPQTSYNFALAVEWTMAIAENDFMFVAWDGLSAQEGRTELETGIHIITVPARNDDLTLAVGVTNGNIDAVAISHRDTRGIVDAAVLSFVQNIVQSQELEVDTFTGATNTSVAVQDALASLKNGDATLLAAESFGNVSTLTIENLLIAQESWANAIVDISNAFRFNEDFVTLANEKINSLYGFEYGTLISIAGRTINNTQEALAYLIGTPVGNISPISGNGFALGIENITFNEGSWLLTDVGAIWNGQVSITNTTGNVTNLNKTFGYIIGGDGNIIINMQIS